MRGKKTWVFVDSSNIVKEFKGEVVLVIILVSGKYLEVSGRDGPSLAINSFEMLPL